MIRPDLILVWPRYLDYPKFRNFINTNKYKDLVKHCLEVMNEDFC